MHHFCIPVQMVTVNALTTTMYKTGERLKIPKWVMHLTRKNLRAFFILTCTEYEGYLTLTPVLPLCAIVCTFLMLFDKNAHFTLLSKDQPRFSNGIHLFLLYCYLFLSVMPYFFACVEKSKIDCKVPGKSFTFQSELDVQVVQGLQEIFFLCGEKIKIS